MYSSRNQFVPMGLTKTTQTVEREGGSLMTILLQALFSKSNREEGRGSQKYPKL